MEAGEPLHAGQVGGASIWFRVSVPSTETVDVDTSASGIDTLVGVYTGDSLGTLVEVASNDDTGSSTRARLQFVAQAGVSYYVAIDGKLGAVGPLLRQFFLAPINDDFADARTAPAAEH